MNQMQELLHMEEVEINAQKKEDKIQILLQKKTSNPLCPDF